MSKEKKPLTLDEFCKVIEKLSEAEKSKDVVVSKEARKALLEALKDS